MKQKIMILGASMLQLPAIIKARQMGLETVAVDMDRNAVGFGYADICLPISTIAVSEVLEAAKELSIDGIMTLASDMPMQTVAAVARKLRLVGISEQTALQTTNKARMRERLAEQGVPVPDFFCVDDFASYCEAASHFEKNYIVKPADNSGSRGVFLVSDPSLRRHGYDYSKQFSRSGELVVEEYMQGQEVSVEALTVCGHTEIIAITDKLTTGAPHFVEMGHSQPSRHPLHLQQQIREVTESAVEAVGIDNGPSHTEIMITAQGAKVVELGARMGGDNITTALVPLSTGVDMVACCIDLALGHEPDISVKFHKASAIRYFPISSGTITGIENVEEAELLDGVEQIVFTKQVSDVIMGINSSVDRVGFVISQARDAESAVKWCEKAISIIKVTTNGLGAGDR